MRCGSAHRPRRRISLAEVVPFIDWTPFFHTWELRGVYPKILQHEKHGEEATKLFADAQKLLAEFIAKKSLQLRARLWIVPGERRRRRRGNLHQRFAHSICGRSFISCASKLKKATARRIGAWRISSRRQRCNAQGRRLPRRLCGHVGHWLEGNCRRASKPAHDDYNAIMAEAIADRLAEAFAEFLHKRVREEWGFGQTGKSDDRRSDRGKISRHPPGRRLSRLP